MAAADVARPSIDVDPSPVHAVDAMDTAEVPPAAESVFLRTDRGRGGTGNVTWKAAKALKNALLAMEASGNFRGIGADQGMRVLELGAGTGELAIELARAGWRNIVATDGEPAVVRNMKYNVHANKVGHSIRCLKWDWADAPPNKLDLTRVGLCIASDVVYYDRPHTDLAVVLRRLFDTHGASANEMLGVPTRGLRVLMMSTVRMAHRDEGGQVVHLTSPDGLAGWEGSSLERFVTEELPEAGLGAQLLWPIPGSGEDDMTSFRLYDISPVSAGSPP
mmetsp:Transcript_35629/g.101522  ORF Transcript_35629/g.101522 Transcript_35629/m.101522 type:complete len:277 (+) Transcript_35629:81-911(+)